MDVIVVGGGIGGLAAAVALHRTGHAVTLFEQADRFGEAGSGLVLWPNAIRALQALGLTEQVRDRSRVAHEVLIRNAAGRLLARTDGREVERRFGRIAIVHRAELLDALRSALPESVLRSGIRVTAASTDGTVWHSGGAKAGAELVVAADGINSVVRTAVWPGSPRPRYVGYTAYRMLSESAAATDAGESWGRGERFGYAALPDRRVYCFAVAGVPEGAGSEPLDRLRARFGRWHDPIPELLQGVSADAVLHHDLYEMPRLDTYVAGRVALLGDAAHAMTPDLGQGAGQALEDAVTLAASLNAEPDIPSALRAYDRDRRPRTQAIAARSRLLGRVAQWRSAPAVALRNGLLGIAPGRSLIRSLAPVLSWQPPAYPGKEISG